MNGLRPVWAVKAIVVIVFTSILFRCVCGINHTVGGASGWDLRSNIQAWSSTTTFNVGDDLIFSYTPIHDVVEVNEQGYDTCTIVNALATYNSGDTVIHLKEPGHRYFVCGRMGHCQQGLKLRVQVQSNNNRTNDDENQRRGSRGRSPDLAHPPEDIHDPAPANGPCDCSRAEESHEPVPLITLVIILAFTLTPFFFAFSHLSGYT